MSESELYLRLIKVSLKELSRDNVESSFYEVEIKDNSFQLFSTFLLLLFLI